MLRARIGRIVAAVARRAPLALLRRAMPRDVVAFLWHTFADAPLTHVGHLYPFKTPAEFERDLLWIARHFRVVAYDAVREARAGGRPLPPRAALLSLDDGMRECLDAARPLLLKHGLPAAFFVTTGFLDNRRLFYRHKVSLAIDAARRLAPAERSAAMARLAQVADVPEVGVPTAPLDGIERWLLALGADREATIDAACAAFGVDADAFLRERRPYLTSDEVRALAADGFTIGGHGRTHVRLGALPSAAAVEEEIVHSCRVAAQLAGRDRAPFAFPFHGADVDRDLLASITAAHPEVELLFDTGGVRRDRPFIVHRMGVDAPPTSGEETTLPREVRDAYRREFKR
ncbi:MAG: polysaccharide deacetylase family protein [Gemmatimonadaceae bacterium]